MHEPTKTFLSNLEELFLLQKYLIIFRDFYFSCPGPLVT